MENGIDTTLVITIAATVIGVCVPFLAIINTLALFILRNLKDSDRQQWDVIRALAKEMNQTIGELKRRE